MATTTAGSQPIVRKPQPGTLKRWLLAGYVKEIEGPFEREKEHHRNHPWWKVMCLTGVDYFSTLGSDHERDADREQLRDGAADPSRGVQPRGG
jgi:hypothetical protein